MDKTPRDSSPCLKAGASSPVLVTPLSFKVIELIEGAATFARLQIVPTPAYGPQDFTVPVDWLPNGQQTKVGELVEVQFLSARQP